MRILRVIVSISSVWLFGCVTALAEDNYVWTVLKPQHDSRPPDVQDFDLYDSAAMVASMNANVECFHHHLVLKELAIHDLPTSFPCFCELRFDAVHPLILTDEEKGILKDYFKRGGFITLREDCYPYTQDEFWSVKNWPVIDFLKDELPAEDSGFSVKRVFESDLIFHLYYGTQTSDPVRHELEDNPYTPNRILLSYRGCPSAFVFGRYSWLENDQWVAEPRPFQRVFSLDKKGYELTVNLYVYAMTH